METGGGGDRDDSQYSNDLDNHWCGGKLLANASKPVLRRPPAGQERGPLWWPHLAPSH